MGDYRQNQIKNIFGLNANSRQDDPTNNSKIYKWMLEKQLDTNSNYTRMNTIKILVRFIPYKINYTGFGGVNGIFDVEFLRKQA